MPSSGLTRGRGAPRGLIGYRHVPIGLEIHEIYAFVMRSFGLADHRTGDTP